MFKLSALLKNKGGFKDDIARLFSVVPRKRTRNNRQKVEHKTLHQNITKRFTK